MLRNVLRRLGIFTIFAGLAVAMLPLVAGANHPVTSDGGTDIPNIGAAMNQESYWESYFAAQDRTNIECTKFHQHSGSIPAHYEAAVVKSGSDLVRVYVDPPSQVLGPPNPNAHHPNKRHEAPFSWVMKCDWDTVEDTTTTTVDDSTTTTIEDTTTTTVDDSTTTTVEDTTTTTVEEETTTTVGEETTTTQPEETTTTVPEETTTQPEAPVSDVNVVCFEGDVAVYADSTASASRLLVSNNGEIVRDSTFDGPIDGGLIVVEAEEGDSVLAQIIVNGEVADEAGMIANCTQEAATTTVTTPDVLPFTGIEDELPKAGLALLALGSLTLLMARSRKDEEAESIDL